MEELVDWEEMEGQRELVEIRDEEKSGGGAQEERLEKGKG